MPEPISIALSIIGGVKTIWELKDKILAKEPKLVIEKIWAANFVFYNTNESRRFVLARVRNVGKISATGCIGTLESGDTIERENKLHWADTPYAH